MENNKHNKAVIYCRVSTKEQAEEGNSLVTQERNCREYAAKYSFDVAEVFVEEGESAKTADRTELQKLLRFCADRKNQISAIIIYKIDRLSRNTDDYSQLRLLLKRYNVEIKSTSEYFENTPAGRFMENIIANVAQFDNDVRTERSVGGLKGAVKEGRYVWMAPLGYTNKKINGKSSIVPNDKAPLIQLAFEMMTDKNCTVDVLRDLLRSKGLSTKSGRPLSKSQIYRIINNELYTGWIFMFGEKTKGTFEPIVSEELFKRVQQIRKNNKQSRIRIYRRESPDFPLRRFILHPLNYKLTGCWSKGRSKSYAYYRYIKNNLEWPKEFLESKFQEFMDVFAFDTDILSALVKEMKKELLKSSTLKAQEVESFSSMKNQLKEKQNILIQKNIDGIISDVILKDQLTHLDDEIWKIDKILSQTEEKRFDFGTVIKFINVFLKRPSEVWKQMPYQIKLKIQWFVFPNGVLFDGKEFRTTKISSLFRLKEIFPNEMSQLVGHSKSKYEHTFSSNFPLLIVNNDLVWREIVEELKALDTIVQLPEPEVNLDLREEEYRVAA